MSKASVIEFSKKATVDPVLQARIKEMAALAKERGEDSSQALIKLAGQNGFNFSLEDVVAAREELDGYEEGDLTAEELRAVAGGPTAVEYAVMLSLIIVVCLAAISVLGQGNQQPGGGHNAVEYGGGSRSGTGQKTRGIGGKHRR